MQKLDSCLQIGLIGGVNRVLAPHTALIPKPSARARRQSHTVPARVRRQPRIGSPGRVRGSSAPRRRRNRSTTSPSCTPEPSFFTPHALIYPTRIKAPHRPQHLLG